MLEATTIKNLIKMKIVDTASEVFKPSVRVFCIDVI